MNSNQPYKGNQQQTNEALKKFCDLIKNKRFTDDEVLSLNEELGKSLTGRDDTITQVNKFYNLVKVAEATEATQLTVKLYVLKAQITYATARETISPDFKTFFDASLEKILGNTNSNDRKERLKDFAVFFESVYAYFYFHTKSKSKGGY